MKKLIAILTVIMALGVIGYLSAGPLPFSYVTETIANDDFQQSIKQAVVKRIAALVEPLVSRTVGEVARAMVLIK